ncbi:MAG: SMC family ATPase [Chloroflexi bacterium]|nr:SMC family ATPase [Chloroflexota bacterium]
MIPQYLKITNFMSYRQKGAEIDFAPLSLAVISGHNGAGKSTLIDAITWALWAQTRSVASDDNSVISEGQPETEVIFDFKTGVDEYRIVRRRKRAKSQKSADKTTVDFYVKYNNQWGNISEDSVSKTNTKIISVLRMNYATFSASAFLRQGQAANFSEKSPNERKAVLTQILGLEEYEAYAQVAKEQATVLKNSVILMEGQLEALQQDAYVVESLQEELQQSREQTDCLHKKYKEAQSAYQTNAARLSSINLQKERLDDCQRALLKNQSDWQKTIDLIENAKLKQNQAMEILQRRKEIEDGEQNYRQNEEELLKQYKKREQYYELSQQICTAQNTINAKKAEIEVFLKIKNEEKERLILKESTTVLNKQANIAENELKTAQKNLDALSAEQEILAQTLTQSKLQQSALVTQNNHTLQNLDHLQSTGDYDCPLCHQELTDNKRDSLIIECQEQYLKAQKQISVLDEKIKAYEYKLSENKEAVKQAGSTFKQKTEKLSAWRGQIQMAMKQQQQNTEVLEQINEVIKKYAIALQEEAFCTEIRLILKNCQQQLAELDYDDQIYKDLNEQTTILKPYVALAQELKYAKQSYEETGRQAKSWQESLQILKQDSQEKLIRQEKLIAQTEQADLIQEQTQKSQDNYYQAQQDLQAAQSHLAVSQNRLEQAQEKSRQIKETTQAIAQANTQSALYETLQKAFGKNGMQAMIVEMVVPEISEEANRLLLRLTDGRLTVSLETQKTTKTTGELKDTLDIIIGDELGTRHYEMYSGGEKFRIDFAIRIALSKVLAKRSGAPLPIVIIDEGFGTQDQNGIEYLKEAIAAIAADFEKIFIITHIEELKEFFPSRINVRKEADGSMVSIE